LNSVDDSVICVQGEIVLTASLPSIDDTRLTLAGAGAGLLDDSIVVNADDSATVGSILKVYGQTDDTLTISKLGFVGGYASTTTTSEGGAINVDEGPFSPVVITDSTFLNNRAHSYGGAIRHESSSHLYIASSRFFNNSTIDGDDGGAIHADGTVMYVKNSSFVGNESADHGGAISARRGEFLIVGSDFDSNTAGDDGGAIYFNDDSLSVIESTFIGNSAGDEGGALLVDDTGVIDRSSFRNNHADDGGAIFHDRNTLAITNSFFGGNSAGNDGGSLFLDSTSGSAALLFSSFYDDTAVGDGQSIFRDNAPVSLYGSAVGSSSDDSLIGGSGTIDDTYLIVTGSGSPALSGTGSQTVATGSLELQPLDGDDTGQAGRAPAATSVLVTGAPTSDLGTGVTVDQLGVTRGPAIWTIGARQVAGGAPDPGPTPPAPIPPSAPGDILAVPGNGRVTLSWTAPAATGSFPVSSYQAVLNPGGQTCVVTTTTCTIDGLANGTSYTATVRALSGAGWGPYSSASASFTPAEDPQPPAPTPQPIPAPLAPGENSAQENGQPIAIEVDPNPQDTGVVITGTGFGMEIDGLDAEGRPLNLGPNGVLVLREEREVETNGNGFAPGTTVGLYMDPPVQTDGASVREASSEGVLLGTLVVDDNGEFGGTAELPEEIQAGNHVVQAVGVADSGARRAVNLGVEVEQDRSILITGTRAQVRGRAGVSVDGITAGLVGQRVVPRVKLAGETVYVRGKGVRRVNTEGEFTWQRVTGKKVYVYFTADGVRSNRIILPR